MNNKDNQHFLVGRVVSNKMQKTATVLIERRVRDPVIGKIVLRSSKYHVHIENIDLLEGDLVEIKECRQISKTKHWKLVRILEKQR